MRICVSILPKNKQQAINLIKKAEKAEANFIEMRLDLLKKSTDLTEITQSTTIPLIATIKLKSEKGYFSGTETQRQQNLQNAAKSGFKYVDVNFSNPKRNAIISQYKKQKVKTIISYHNFERTLTVSALEKILDEQIATGADICKIVLTANQIEDNLPILTFISFASTKANLVCFCMGEQGKMSRLLSPAFGAFFTFASFEQGSQTATGQMTISEMKAAYTLLGITQ